MIDLHAFPTPNSTKVPILLEVLGVCAAPSPSSRHGHPVT
jgi:hypothetical protein